MSRNRNKTHELVIDINARSRENIMSDTTFFSMDAGTSEKVIRFTRNHQSFDLTSAMVVIGFHFVDKWASKIIDSEDGSVEIIDAVGGKCSVDIPSHVYDYEGDVLVHVYLKFDNGQSLDCGIISTRFERSWLENELPEMEKVYVKRFEDLAREIRERAEELHRLLDNVDMAIVSQDDFDDHVNDRSNPHEVTIEQIGAEPAIADTGWIDLELIAGLRPHSESTPPQYRRIRNVVYLRGSFTGILENYTLCAILPVGFRPTGQSHTFTQNTTRTGGAAFFARWAVGVNGNIELTVISRPHGGFEDGNWFPINTSFLID